MTENLDKVMDSMDNLSVALKKIDRYNSLFYLTGRMIITALVFTALVLFSYILLLMNDFQNVNPDLGSIQASGNNLVGGTTTNIALILVIIGGVIIYLVTVFLNRRTLKNEEYNIVPFDRTKGRDDVAGEITKIDWGKTKKELKRAKFSFISYNASIVGIYSFLLFFILLFPILLILVFISNVSHINIPVFFYLTYGISSVLSISISVAILRKTLKRSHEELKELDTILSQLRWFLDGFEKSGFQA